MSDSLQDRVSSLSLAELGQDAQLLDTLLANDFYGVGPAGFVLDRSQWLGRFNGDMTITSHELKGFAFREHGNVAVGIGVQTQELMYKDRPNNGSFRITLVFIQENGEWKVLSLHLSPMMGPA